MPLFEGARPIDDSRSNARLSVSQVFSPAERWIHEPTLPTLFEYHYGGPGEVVLSKGTIVAFSGAATTDYETGRATFPITYADGVNKPIGVLPYNVYQNVDDRLLGNQPSILTHEYIELPLIAGAANVYDLDGLSNVGDISIGDLAERMKMKWGCFYIEDPSDIRPGDFLKSDKFGKFIKWTEQSRTYSASISTATNETFSTLLEETFNTSITYEVSTTNGELGYDLPDTGVDGEFVGQIVSVTLDGEEQSDPADYTYSEGTITLDADPGADADLVVVYTGLQFTLSQDCIGIKELEIDGTPATDPADYVFSGTTVITLDSDAGPDVDINVVGYLRDYPLAGANSWGSAVEVDGEEFADFIHAAGTSFIQLTGSPDEDELTVYYNSTDTISSSVSETVTGDAPEQKVGQVLAIETDMPPVGWLKWVTPVVEEGERADNDIRRDAPDATVDPDIGYDYDPNYRWPVTSDHRAPGPWKDYKGVPGLTDGDESGLGAGILPGWDFEGSVGAIRIALRY